MTEAAAVHYRTGTLWTVLTVLLLFGTVASAFMVYGVTTAWSSGALWPWIPIAVAGGVAAGILGLLIVGILYRVDRLRGTPHRRIELFD